jgi:hypothetical protein
MSIYDKASLVLIPSGTKTSKVYSQKPTNGDGDFTFSRSTAATRVNASGNIEKETQNLLTYSNDFSQTAWVKYLVSLTSGQSGYNGSNDAWLIEKSGAFGNIYRNVSVSGVYTWSVYAKAGSFDFLALRFRNTSNNYRTAYFDLSNGTLGSVDSNIIKHTIQDVGSGWYRCQITFNDPAINQVLIYPSDVNNGINNSGTGNIYIQDAQLEQGLVARDYIETTTTAIYGGITDNVPRLDYTDSSCPALLLEPQRTNIVPHSEYVNGMTLQNISATANATISPEGVGNAYEVEPTGTGFKTIGNFVPVTASSKYTISFFYKNVDHKNIGFYDNNTSGSEIQINVQDNTFTLGASCDAGDVEDYGNGWYRAWCTFSASNSTLANYLIFRNDSNNGSYTATGSSIYVYGFQVEQGTYPTSYIPTYGSAVTRNQDTLQLTGMSSDVASGATSGTLMIEFDYTQQSLGDVVQWYSSSTAAGRGYLYNRSLGFADTWGSAGLGTTDGVNTKVIWRLDSLSSGTFFKDGVKGNDVNTTTQAWNNIDNLFIRGHYGTINVRQIIFVPYALSNQEAIDLTTL